MQGNGRSGRRRRRSHQGRYGRWHQRCSSYRRGQRVEHYEIAGYGCVRAYATRLGEDDAATLLSQTLQEEKAADEMLNGIAEQLNIEVPQESGQTEKRTVKSSRG